MRTESYVPAINAGSSCIKFSLFQKDDPPKQRCLGKVDPIGLAGTTLTYSDPARNLMIRRKIGAHDHTSAAKFLIDLLQEQVRFASVMAVQHRIVKWRHAPSRGPTRTMDLRLGRPNLDGMEKRFLELRRRCSWWLRPRVSLVHVRPSSRLGHPK
jgi:hypothetical protein